MAMRLLTRIERSFGVRLNLAAIYGARTIERLAARLEQPEPAGGELAGGLIAIEPNGSKPAFFCVEAISLFETLARRCGLDRPFFTLPPPDNRDLDVPYRIENIAAKHVANLRKVQPHGPYFLGGWCVAGIIAYEMAQQLTDLGEQVEQLALFDTFNQSAMLDINAWEAMKLRSNRLTRKVAYHSRNLGRKLKTLQSNGKRAVGLKEIYAYAAQRSRIIGSDLRATWRPPFQPVETNGSAEVCLDIDGVRRIAAAHYRPRPYSGRVVVFRCAEEYNYVGADPHYGWSKVGVPRLEVCEVGGDHATMFQSPHVEELAFKLLRRLEDTGAVDPKL